jgi:hypothetical protein
VIGGGYVTLHSDHLEHRILNNGSAVCSVERLFGEQGIAVSSPVNVVELAPQGI